MLSATILQLNTHYHFIKVFYTLTFNIPEKKKVVYHVFPSNVTKKKKKMNAKHICVFLSRKEVSLLPWSQNCTWALLCTVMCVQTDTRALFLPHTFKEMLQERIAVKPGKRKTAAFIWDNKSIMWFIENIYNSEKQSRTFGKHLIHSENQNLNVKLSHE